jgi:trans-aconitate methyltransferase
MNLLSRLWDRALQKIVRDPAGYGRPVPKGALDAEYQSGNWDHFFKFSELPRNLVLAGAIHHHFPESPRVLDLGCGSGRLATVFRHYPFRSFLGIDLSTEAIARARALGLPRMEFEEGDFETWRPRGAFEAISFNECIGYARDPAATLEAFRPHLAPGGLFFVSHFRFGSYAAQWRRLERVAVTVDAAAVTTGDGRQTWDIRVLRPKSGVT